MADTKFIYFFGDGKAEGDASMKKLLGGKGANLAEMTNLGIPVPPGFTIATEVCDSFYKNNRNYPKGMKEELAVTLGKLETMMGKKLGDPKDPLLVSVRSGAAVSAVYRLGNRGASKSFRIAGRAKWSLYPVEK